MSAVQASPPQTALVSGHGAQAGEAQLLAETARLRRQVEVLHERLRRREDQRRAMLHIMHDLHDLNTRLASQRKAMAHILADYELDRRRLARQTEKLDASRRALLHILQDQHQSNFKLEKARKAMIHIMDDLRKTTAEIVRREQELRDKQEQLVQAGKLATLGELTTGIAHELNNPLNNIGLFLGNVIDLVELGRLDKGHALTDLHAAVQQVRKATEIISHLRTFGRLAPVGYEEVAINEVVQRSLELINEQLRLRDITVELDLSPANPIIMGSPIQLEQVFMNILANARDALAEVRVKVLRIRSTVGQDHVELSFSDTGPGIPKGLEQRIFDPFFTTKEVGHGTGLGLSIAYGIIKDHQGSITATSHPGEGATFLVQLPLVRDDRAAP